ncbi:hypothetical protein ACGF8B_37910 [Streptomyces sp. NPDC047917]|uniref:hypothetical protein n=1 Tax=Streptomyces sp. NPDC047917 TaxID=3365491 RepID=UPI00371FD2CB
MMARPETDQPTRRDKRIAGREPDRVEVTQVLSQDVVLGTPVVVDIARHTPVLAFHNPGETAGSDSDGHQALVFCPRQGPVPDIRHVARALGTATGWRVSRPFESWLQEQAKQPGWSFKDLTVSVRSENGARTVVAHFCVVSPSQYGKPAAQVFSSELSHDGTQWADPVVSVPPPPETPQGAFDTIDTTYTAAGKPVVYAVRNAPGGVWLKSDAFDVVSGFFGQVPDGPTVAVALRDTYVVIAAVVSGGLSALFQEGNDSGGNVQTAELPFQPKQVIGGFVMGQEAVFLVTDSDGGLWTAVCDGQWIKAGRRLHAKGTVRVDSHPTAQGGRDIYVVDTDRTCWVYRLTSEGSSAGVPLQKDLAAVATPPSPLETSTVFLAEAGTETGDETKNELRLDVQDSATGLWRRVHVHDPAEGVKDVTRYRLEATVYDRCGAPMPRHTVTLARASDSSEGEITVGGQVTEITDKPTPLVTDAFGKVTIAVTPNRLTAPNLVLKVDGLKDGIPLRPAQDTQDYLQGTKKKRLNLTNPAGALPDFEGKALAEAKVPGQGGRPTAKPLAPLAQEHPTLVAKPAALVMRKLAAYWFEPASDASPGFHLSVTRADDGIPRLDVRELTAEEAKVSPDDSWEQNRIATGDLVEGLHNGTVELRQLTFDATSGWITLGAEIYGIYKEFKASLKKTIEAIWKVIGKIFDLIGAALAKVVDWLKAWFDFPAIWNTKKAFEQSVDTMLGEAEKAVAEVGKLTAGWFMQQEKDVEKSFQDAQDKLGAKTAGSVGTWPGKGKQGTPVTGAARLADLGGGNAHLNWFQDRAIGTGADFAGNDEEIIDDDAWKSCADKLGTAGDKFVTGVKELLDGFARLISKPGDLQAQTLATLLDAFKNLALAALDFGDGVAQALAVVVSKALAKLKTSLNAARDPGLLSRLWRWIAEMAGDKDAPLTVSGVVCLLGALPVTLIYRLIKGNGAQPFPPKTPAPAQAAARRPATYFTSDTLLVAAILQTVQVVPCAISDFGAWVKAKGEELPYLGTLALVANMLLSMVVMELGFEASGRDAWFWAGLLILVLGAGTAVMVAVANKARIARLLDRLVKAGDPIPIALTFKGVIWDLRLALLEIGKGKDADYTTGRIFLAVPPAATAMTHQRLLQAPDAGELVFAAKELINVAFIVVGGALLIKHYS